MPKKPPLTRVLQECLEDAHLALRGLGLSVDQERRVLQPITRAQSVVDHVDRNRRRLIYMADYWDSSDWHAREEREAKRDLQGGGSAA